MQHKIHASAATPGFVEVKDGKSLVLAFWAWDVMAVSEDYPGAKISLRTGEWHPVAASPGEVMATIEGAMTAARVAEKAARAA